MTIIVQKYGGSSLNGVTRIRQVVAVVSAMSNSIDNLIKLAQKLTISPDDRELDLLMSAGKLVSATLMTMALKDMGCRSISLSGLQAGIQTDNQCRRARIINIETKRIHEELARGNVVIVTGFQGTSLGMEITTLGSGESDTIAVTLGKISAVGTGMQKVPGFAKRLFQSLAENHIEIHLITTSEIRITCAIREMQVPIVVQSLHKSFGLDNIT